MRPRLTIRRKVLFGFLLAFCCLGLLAEFAYFTLQRMEDKIQSLEGIDDIASSILEVRRQEKNYLLYGEDAIFELVTADVDATLALFPRVQGLVSDPSSRAMLETLLQDLLMYRSAVAAMHESIITNQADADSLRDDTRNVGKTLVERAQALSAQKRADIMRISFRLRGQLLTAVIGIAALLALILFGVVRYIMKPLRIIESATASIARGNFQPFNEDRKDDDEIKQVQNAFNRMMRELKSRHEQLVHTQKLSSIGTLSAGIAHQVNNPLNNISTSAQLLRGALPADAGPFIIKMLNNIDKETVRARDIVRGLLDFARQSELTLCRVSLRSVIDKTVALVSSQIPAGVSLSVDVPEDVAVDIDPQRMTEALLNLIINAAQAIGGAQGAIRLRLEEAAGPGKTSLVVEDNGQGIAPEDLPHIFDPFFTRKEVGKGTGLGLSVVYGIVEEFGGDVRVESEPGKGTRFFLDLPLPEGPHSSEGGAR